MVGPAVLTFVKELGEHFGSEHPALFGFIDSLEGVDLASEGLEFLENSYFWEAYPRYAGANPSAFDSFYREKVGVDANGASVDDPADVSTYSHMFGCWETLFVLKHAMEASGYQSATDADKKKLIEAVEAMEKFEEGNEHPQGDKVFNGKLHQAFGHQNITQVKGGKAEVVHRTSIEDGLYEPEGDYTTMGL
jgi:branched-chain amino acid transport system substrate-binding protein